MDNKLLTEKDIKKAMNVKSFKKLPAERHEELAKLLVNAKKDVSVGIISQLPQFVDYGKAMISKLSDVCTTILSNNKKSHDDTIAAYISTLDSLKKELDSKWLTFRKRRKITEEMTAIADKIAARDDEFRKSNMDFFKSFGQIGLVLLSTVITVTTVATKMFKK